MGPIRKEALKFPVHHVDEVATVEIILGDDFRLKAGDGQYISSLFVTMKSWEELVACYYPNRRRKRCKEVFHIFWVREPVLA